MEATSFIALVTVMKQRDVIFSADNHGKSRLSQVISLLLVLAPLGNITVIIRGVDVGEKIGRVIKQGICLDPVDFKQTCQYLLLGQGDGNFSILSSLINTSTSRCILVYFLILDVINVESVI